MRIFYTENYKDSHQHVFIRGFGFDVDTKKSKIFFYRSYSVNHYVCLTDTNLGNNIYSAAIKAGPLTFLVQIPKILTHMYIHGSRIFNI